MGRTKKTKKTDLGPARDAGDVLGPARDADDSPEEMDINEPDPQDDPHDNTNDADLSDDDSTAVKRREFV